MGKSSSQANTTTSTTYNTTTTTDVGLTGADAVNFEGALLNYAAASQQADLNAIGGITSQLSSFGIVPNASPPSQSAPPTTGSQTPPTNQKLILYGAIAVVVLFLVWS